MHPFLALNVDSTAPEILVDAFFLIFVVVNAVLGWKMGFMRRLVAFIGVILGIVLAAHIGNSIANVLPVSPYLYAQGWGYAVCMLAVLAFSELIGFLYNAKIQSLAAFGRDDILGMIAGIAVAVVEVSFLFLIVLSVGHVIPTGNNGVPLTNGVFANTIRNATLGGFIVMIEPVLSHLFTTIVSLNAQGYMTF